MWSIPGSTHRPGQPHQDAEARLVITAPDVGYDRGKLIPLKPVVDAAVASCPLWRRWWSYDRTRGAALTRRRNRWAD